MTRFQSILILALAALPGAILARDSDRFEKREFRSVEGGRLRYRIFSPEGSGARPLVIWLHDILGIGIDNRRQISGANEPGAELWIGREIQERHASFVIAPQCPPGSLWANPITKRPTAKLRLVIDLVEDLERELPIDRERVYLVGQSMGGYGVWALLAARPDLFAAGVPVAAAGDSRLAGDLASIPVWIFHGRRDILVRVGEARAMVKALRAAGGDPKYTEYPRLGHTRGFFRTVFAEPGLPDWLFSQRRLRRSV